MKRTGRIRGARWLVCLWLLTGAGCSSPSAPSAPLDLTTLDPTQDQLKIATHYRHVAALLRQKSEEQFIRATVYTRLFGSDSDWVVGARLLAQSYEEAAQEHERLAEKHLALAGDRAHLK